MAQKVTPTVTTFPTAAAIVYGQALSASLLSDGEGSVPGAFSFTTPASTPDAGTANQLVTFTPTDTDGYETVEINVSVTVNKATPTVTTPPTAAAIVYGQALSASTLSDGVGSVAGAFDFTTSTTTPVVGTASQSVTFTPTDAANYETVEFNVSVTVNKATPTVTTPPTAAAIVYGQALVDSSLSDGVGSVDGVFAFTTPAFIPELGTASQSVTFTPTDAVNYNTVVFNVSVTVNKPVPTITAWPTASAIAYGQALSDSSLSGGAASMDGVFAFTAPATTPALGTASQSVTFTPTDTAYGTVVGVASVTVGMGTPTVTTWPTAASICYGQTLEASSLINGVASVAGSFTFIAPNTVPAPGTANQPVLFTPADPSYIPVAGAASVTVAQSTPAVWTWPTASAIIYGQALSNSTLTGGSGSVPGIFVFALPASTPALGMDSQPVLFMPDNTINHMLTGMVSVAVGKATPVVTTLPTASAITYGQALGDSTLSGGAAPVAGSFTFTRPALVPNAGTANQSMTFTPADTDNYETVVLNVSVTVNKATPAVTTWPAASAISYGQALSASILGSGAASVPGAFAFTSQADIPVSGTAGQSVTFTPTDTLNYNTPGAGVVSVAVNKATPVVTTLPIASDISSGQALSASVLSGGAASVAGCFAFTSPTDVPALGTADQPMTFTPDDAANYNTVACTVSVTVKKYTPTVTAWPTASPITYGQALSNATLIGGSASVAGSFAFTTPCGRPPVCECGKHCQSVTFTPSDAANYNTCTGSVSVTVKKADQTIAFPAIGEQHRTHEVALSATASSGLPVSFEVAAGPAYITDGVLHYTQTGLVCVVASQTGNVAYAAATPVTMEVTVIGGHAPGDYSGEGSTALTVYDPVSGRWYCQSKAGRMVMLDMTWGGAGMMPVEGDFDGDGIADPAVYDEANGQWYIRTMAGVVLAWGLEWGGPGMNPVPGDYNGDGATDLAMYDEANGRWYIRTLAGTVLAWACDWGFPNSGMQPVAGDYDGDGVSDLCMYDEANGLWYAYSGAMLGGPVTFAVNAPGVIAWAMNWGGIGCQPVMGDYDGDQVSDLAVYSEVSGKWFIRTLAGNVLAWDLGWGGPGAKPVPGDYDGDRAWDMMVMMSADGMWYARSVTQGTILLWGTRWGGVGTEPVMR